MKGIRKNVDSTANQLYFRLVQPLEAIAAQPLDRSVVIHHGAGASTEIEREK
jgi:hypothetical protein